MRNISWIVLCTIFLMGCSHKKEEQIEKRISNEESSLIEKDSTANIQHNKLKLSKSHQLAPKSEKDLKKKILEGKNRKKKSKTIMINKQKFKLISENFVKGAKVYSFLMSELGVVKGTFVVITKRVEKLSQFDKTKKINEIAKNTYRLVPDNNTYLLDYYHLLRASKQFTQVEMEIDYSGTIGLPISKER